MLVVHRDLKVIVNILNVAVWYMFMTGRSGGVEEWRQRQREKKERDTHKQNVLFHVGFGFL